MRIYKIDVLDGLGVIECAIADTLDAGRLLKFVEDGKQAIEQQPASKQSAQEIRSQALKDAAQLASMFSVKPGRSLHPGIKWENMKQEVQMAAHSAAQQIAVEISMLNQSQEG